MTPELRPLLAALVALLAAQTGFPVGWAAAPIGPDGAPYDPADDPYAVVWPLTGGDTWGPFLTGPDEGAQVPVQVTSVGARGDQAQGVADRVRQVMVGRTNGTLTHQLVVPGVTVLDREFSSYGGQDREGDVVSIPDTFLIHVTV